MARFMLSRVIQSIVTILVISMVVFVMARATGDPVTLLASTNATAQDIAVLRQQLGLDQPLAVQYWVFITNAVRGNLGKSLANRADVAQQIGERLPNSAAIGLPALLLSTVLGMSMGVAAAVKRDTWVDKSIRVVAVLGQSMPAFWVSIMAIFVFSVLL